MSGAHLTPGCSQDGGYGGKRMMGSCGASFKARIGGQLICLSKSTRAVGPWAVTSSSYKNSELLFYFNFFTHLNLPERTLHGSL